LDRINDKIIYELFERGELIEKIKEMNKNTGITINLYAPSEE
jgi:hypothetical protein